MPFSRGAEKWRAEARNCLKAELICLLFAFFERVCACRSAEILLFSEAAPSRVDDHKTLQQSFRDDTQFGKNGFVAILRIFEHVLYCNKVITGNDAFMLTVVMTDRTFTAVLYRFVGENILCMSKSIESGS